MSCAQSSCRGGIDCCRQYQDATFCLTQSQCTRNPVWELVIILAFMFVIFVGISTVVYCKLKGQQAKRLSVQNFAQHQIRMEPKTSQERLKTFSSMF